MLDRPDRKGVRSRTCAGSLDGRHPGSCAYDDDGRICAVLEAEGLSVSTAQSGADALRRLHDQRYDLLLCDVGMPEMSGWQVAREIQRIAPGTVVWMLTGWANEIGESDPRLDYVSGVLAKPLDLERLRLLLHASSGPPAMRPDVSAVH